MENKKVYCKDCKYLKYDTMGVRNYVTNFKCLNPNNIIKKDHWDKICEAYKQCPEDKNKNNNCNDFCEKRPHKYQYKKMLLLITYILLILYTIISIYIFMGRIMGGLIYG